MKQEINDQEKWDELLESKAGMDAFAELMKEAQKEVEEGKFDESTHEVKKTCQNPLKK